MKTLMCLCFAVVNDPCTHTHTYMQTYRLTEVHAHTHARAHTHTHACTHTCIPTNRHMHRHAHGMYAHTRMMVLHRSEPYPFIAQFQWPWLYSEDDVMKQLKLSNIPDWRLLFLALLLPSLIMILEIDIWTRTGDNGHVFFSWVPASLSAPLLCSGEVLTANNGND